MPRHADLRLSTPLLSRDASDGLGAMAPSRVKTTAKLGVFLGVFVPTMNTIFGVVVFLRWGWAVGQAGLLQVTVMVLIGHAIALLTCASVSAICTNGEVGPGGAYYIISRALGPEFGGSIGALFYIAQATGVAFYMLGLAETVLETLPFSPIKMVPFLPDEWGGLDPSGHAKYGDTVLVSSAALLVVFIISMVGASFFAKASLAIFGVIVSALFGAVLSFLFYSADSEHITGYEPSLNFTGMSMHTLRDNLHSGFSCVAPCGRDAVDEGLAEGGFAGTLAVFGVVMPSMTGILAGANMSGDLEDPGRAIPQGTFAAIGCMFLSYSVVILVNAAAVDRSELITDYQIMQKVCFWPYLVFVGTLCTTFSSALSGLVGTARVLQAIALDFPVLKWFAQTSGSDAEPRRAVVVSYLVSQCTLFLGTVNAIAPIVGNFMLVMFVVLNLACATLELTEAPNFRPSYRLYSWKGALLGALMSFLTMFALNFFYAAVTCVIVAVLFVYISVAVTNKDKLSSEWGDVNQGLLFRFATQFLLSLDVRKTHVKFWQPQILLLQPPRQSSEALDTSAAGRLISFAADLKASGVLTLGHVFIGELAGNADLAARILDEQNEREVVAEKLGVRAFTEVSVAPTLSVGVQALILSAGISALRPNTVLIGMHGRSRDRSSSTGQWAGSSPVHQRLDTASSSSVGSVFDEESQSAASESDTTSPGEYVAAVRAALRLRRSVLIARGFDVWSRANVSQLLEATTDEWQRMKRIDISGHGPRAGGRVDVWLPPFGADGVDADDEQNRVLLTLQMAQILHSVPFWASNTRLRCCVLTTADAAATQESRLHAIMARSRMYFDIEVINIEQEPAFKRLKESMHGQRGGGIGLARSVNASVEMGAAGEQNPDPGDGPAVDAKLRSTYVEHLHDLELLSALSQLERNRLLNLMIRKHTLRNSALLFIHQDYYPGLCGATSRNEPGFEAAWIEEIRVLTENLPPVILVSPNAADVTTAEA